MSKCNKIHEYNDIDIYNVFEKRIMFSLISKTFNNKPNIIFQSLSTPTVVKRFKYNQKKTTNKITWFTQELFASKLKYKTVIKTIGAYHGFDVKLCKSSPDRSKYIGILSQSLYYIKVSNWSVALIFNKQYGLNQNTHINKPDIDNFDYVQFVIKPINNNVLPKDISVLKNIFKLCKNMTNVKGGSYLSKNITTHLNILPVRIKHNSDLFVKQKTLNKNVYYNDILKNLDDYCVARICKGIPYIILFINNMAYFITKNIVDVKKISIGIGTSIISAIKYLDEFIIKKPIVYDGKYITTTTVNQINNRNTYFSQKTGWDTIKYTKMSDKYRNTIKSFNLQNSDILEFSKIGDYFKNKPYIWSLSPIPITLFCKSSGGVNYILYATATKRYIRDTGIKKTEFDEKMYNPDSYYQPVRFSPSTQPFAYEFTSDIDLDNKYVRLTYNYDKSKWNYIETVNNTETLLFGDDFKYIEQNTWNLYRNPITKENLCINLHDLSKQMYFTNIKNPMHYAPIKMNNMVKHSLIKKSSTKVIDLASGRGSDLQTYRNLGIPNLLFCEIDNDAIDTLTQRKYTMRGENNTMLSVFSTDLNKPYKKNLLTIQDKYQFDNVSHIYSFFALHYLTGSSKNITNITCLISKLLAKDGLFIYTSFDKTAIGELLKDGKWEVFENGVKKYSICYKDSGSNKSDKHISIKLILPFNVNTHYYTEELINDKLLDSAFKKQKMKVIKEARFMSCEKMFKDRFPQLYHQLTPADKIFINLYKYKIYKKTH